MRGKEQQQVDERHRNLGTPIWQVFDHEVGPYRVILIGHKPVGAADDISLDDLRKDVEDQLTLLLAGEEWLRKKHRFGYLFRSPLYGEILENLEEITRYRNNERERFMTDFENKLRELYKDETIDIGIRRS